MPTFASDSSNQGDIEPAKSADTLRLRMALLHLTTVPMSLRFLQGQLSYYAACGFAVHVLSSPGPELEFFARREGATVHAVPMARRIAPLRDLRSLFGVFRVVRQIRPGIVHAHTPKAGLLGIIAAWILRVPVRIYHLHGLPFVTTRGLRRWFLVVAERIACALATRVLCVSSSLRSVAIESRLCSPTKIHVILGGSSNGVDVARFKPNAQQRRATRERLGIRADALVIGYVGRIVCDKGVVELETAWLRLRELYSDLHWLVVGPFEVDDAIPEETAARMRADPRVHLTGLQWDTPPLFAAMDVLLLASHREGFGVVAIEAAAAGLPVVATRIPGLVDAVQDGVTGTLVAPRDVRQLEQATRRYLDDESLRHAHGAAGRERVQVQFRREAIWGETLRQYSVLAKLSSLGRHREDDGALR